MQDVQGVESCGAASAGVASAGVEITADTSFYTRMENTLTPVPDMTVPKEWGVVGQEEIELLGVTKADFRCLLLKVLTPSLACTAAVVLYMPHPKLAWDLQFARFVMLWAFFMEMVRGWLHFLFPYSSHCVVSGMADTCKCRHHPMSLAILAVVTHQFGAANLILGFLYGILLVCLKFQHYADDLKVFALAMAATTIVRFVQAANSMGPASLRFFRAALPLGFLQGKSVDDRKKAPPGKTMQEVQIVIQLAGMAATACAWMQAPAE